MQFGVRLFYRALSLSWRLIKGRFFAKNQNEVLFELSKSVKLPNITLITVDSLRRDHLGCYGYNHQTSEAIDRVAREGCIFSDMISNGGGTPEAFAPIMASCLRSEKLHTMRDATSLAQVLKKCGYRTAAFHSNPLISHYYSYDKGFDVFFDSFSSANQKGQTIRTALSALKARPPIVQAEELTNKALRWYSENSSESKFLWIHYMDVHTPYIPPAKYIQKYLSAKLTGLEILQLYRKIHHTGTRSEPIPEKDLKKLIALYDAAINYVDDSVRRIIDAIQKNNNYALVLTADHGDEFGEHGVFGHQTLYENIIHVPFIIQSSGIDRVISDPGLLCSLDIAPSIIELAGISEPSFSGRSFVDLPPESFPLRDSTLSWSDYAGREGTRLSYRVRNWKLIVSSIKGQVENELYDLQKDPGESENLAEKKVELTRILSNEIPKWIERNGGQRSRIAQTVRNVVKSQLGSERL
jgi:arylsulfatase A-like enzyme